MNRAGLAVDLDRLLGRLERLAEIGAAPDGACRRLAATDADRDGRDLVAGWMRELGLAVTVDVVGNVWGLRSGREALAPAMTGSHIDTVATGGRYDGNLGVLAGLEVVEALNAAGIVTRRPLAVGFFTNEEGARFVPDMLGSLVFAGGLAVEEALAARAADGATLGEELTRIGYAGTAAAGALRPHAFVELHIEQGPLLEADGVTIGAVEDLQGISWQEVTIAGQSNHAGTTPMRLRRDAGFAAAAIAAFVRDLAYEMGGAQVGTVGRIVLEPNLINVVAARASLTVDLRNTDDALLRQAEDRLAEFLGELATAEAVRIQARRLVRLQPVRFDPAIVRMVERTAARLGHSCRRITSGAGHDAQMLARICPTAMVFVPSAGGISHNPAEYTQPADIAAGANVLLHVLLELAES